MTKRRPAETRARILAAAEDLACEVGPTRISIEAVAARAGVSKGGLLYHFHTKHDLLRALVAEHAVEMQRALVAACAADGGPLDLAQAYLRIVRAKLDEACAPPGIFAAIAEDPEFIAPLRAFRQQMLEDVFRRCPDPDLATVVFFACEGLVHIRLTDPQDQDPAVRGRVFETLDGLLEGGTAQGRDR